MKTNILMLAFFVIALFRCAVAAVAGEPTQKEKLLFSFGLIADVQYADEDAAGRRHYRTALAKLEECVADLNTKELAFTIQLGDFIEYGSKNLERALAVFNTLKMKKYHVLGNHDFMRIRMRRAELLKKLGMQKPYYDFSYGNCRFVVLDGVDISTSGGWPTDSENYKLGKQMLDELREQELKWGQGYNGAIGKKQLAWLDETLKKASAKGEKVIVVCHLPTLAAASTEYHLLWNHEEVLRTLESHDCVVAYFNGHDHAGGYAKHKGIHYVTVQGMVEAPQKNAYATVDVYQHRLELRGIGKVPHRTLKVWPRPKQPAKK